MRFCWLTATFIPMMATVLSAEPPNQLPGKVKVAAVQICGYDKTDVPREGFDPTEEMVPYIDNAGKDGAQLVVFPEYVLGRIQVPGDETKKIAEAAAANQIYVIAGCWELYEDATFANTALIFDWPTRIVARCPDRKEAYITGTINMEQVRTARRFSRNFQQRRPDLYGELVKGAAVPLQDASPQHPK